MRCSTFILIIFIIGCTGVPKEIPSEKNASVSVYFCAKDNCMEQFYKSIESANSYVHCSLFNLDDKKLTSLLTKKSKQLDLKIFFNNKNYRNQINKANIRLSQRTNHNKFCVIDDNLVVTGSFNPTKSELKNNNNLLVLNSRSISKNYEDEFKEQWYGLKEAKTANDELIINNKKVINLFCPDDNCIRHYINALERANKSIYFMAYSFTNEDVADTLIKKNIEIKGILEDSQAKNRYSQYKRLRGFGINVKLYQSNITLHHKVFIIDNATVITGSLNPTNNGFFRNDENIIIFYDSEIARKYLNEFDRLLSK